MELDLSNFNVRKTNPIIIGNAGLPENVERYTVKGQEIIGINIYKDDKINIVNLEGSQELEITSFDIHGENKSLINLDLNNEAKFLKHILKNSDSKDSLITKLQNKNINFNNIKSSNIFNKETEAGAEEEFII